MKKSIITLAVIIIHTACLAQLSGEYTIGGTSPDYTNITNAATALNDNGVNGPVTFLIRDGEYEDTWNLGIITGISAENKVTFISESGDNDAVIIKASTLPENIEPILWDLGYGGFYRFESLTFLNEYTGGNDCYSIGNLYESEIFLLEIVNCKLIANQEEEIELISLYHFENLLIENSHFDGGEYLVELYQGANAVIQNCVFENSLNSCLDIGSVENLLIEESQFISSVEDLTGIDLFDSFGVVNIYNNTFTGEQMDFIDGNEVFMDSLNILNNSFNAEFGGVYIESYLGYLQTVIMEGNTSTSEWSSCWFEGVGSIELINNEFTEVAIGNSTENIEVRNNKFTGEDASLRIYDPIISLDNVGVIENNSFEISLDDYSGSAIEISDITMNNDDSFKIQNNSISNFESGIYLDRAQDIVIKFNTFSSDYYPDSFVAAWAAIGSEINNITISNNIVFFSDTADFSGVMYDFPESAEFSIHDNVYSWDTSNEDINFMEIGDVDYATISDAQAAGYAQNAIMANPEFYDQHSDLRICNQNLTGVYDEEVPTDYYGQPRADPPTPGFYELVPLNTDFTYTQVDNVFALEAVNLNAAQEVIWDFGDGSTSNSLTPTHTYSELGNYTITLSVTSNCGEESGSQEVSVSFVGVEELTADVIVVYPNPTQGIIHLDLLNTAIDKVIIYDIIGKEVFVADKLTLNNTIDISSLRNGLFLLVGFGQNNFRVGRGIRIMKK